MEEIVDRDILVTSRIGDRKSCNLSEKTGRLLSQKKEVEPVQPVQVNICQSNTYTKDLS